MSNKTRIRLAKALNAAYAILSDAPNGLAGDGIMQQLRRTVKGSKHTEQQSDQLWQDFSFGAIGPRNAGWLVESGGLWRATDAGKEAFRRHPDALNFFDAAGSKSWKGWVATRLPGSLILVTRVIYQIQIEWRLIRRVGLIQLLKELLGSSTPWQAELPMQHARTLNIAGLVANEVGELEAHFRACNAAYNGGGHTVYLPPESWSRTAFASIQPLYPPNSGLKILRNPGRIANTGYVNEVKQGISKLHKMITHDHGHLTLVSNLFYQASIGPKPIDLVELQLSESYWVANVVEHVAGRVPSNEETQLGLQKIKDLESQGVIKVSMPDGFEDEDFRVPDCNGNALVDTKGWKYIDHQNFLLTGYEDHLVKAAKDSAGESHFGDRSLLRGKQYLYQSVPGVALPGKRNPARRMEILVRMMERAGVGVQGKLVLDVGCNVGMMTAQYLKIGAHWCHGWDTDVVAPKTESLLRAVGCTRFSLTGGNVMQNESPENDVPAFLAPMMNGCAISYLAVHRWIGWLPFLGRVPWQFLIFEGHEQDTDEFNRQSFKNFSQFAKFEVAEYEIARDGDSDPRAVAILIRRE